MRRGILEVVSRLNIAHRGASSRSPENTIAAFLAAADAGAHMVELDLQASRDGALVVIHDETVDRTTDGRGRVADMTLDELMRLDAGSWFGERFAGERIPTLDLVFEAMAGRCGLNVELKTDGIEASVCALFRKYSAHGSSIVSCFDREALERVGKADPSVRTALLSEMRRDELVMTASAIGAYAVNPRADMVDADLCESAHAHGLKVYPWTVDEPELMRFLFRAGVDGIMTNRPDVLSRVIGGD